MYQTAGMVTERCIGMDRVHKPTLYLPGRVSTAIARIREFEPQEGYYLADSGGKDSSVILRLAEMAGVSFESHYAFTTVDPPELLRFLREHHSETEWHRPERSMWQLIIDMRMPPSRRARYCCDKLKERLGGGHYVLTGMRWAESRNRSGRKMVQACLKDKTKIFVNPIIDWLEHEVWDFILTHNVPYCSLYDDGFERLGCVLCPLQSSKKRQRDAEYFPKFYKAYMSAFAKMMEARVKAGKTKGSWRTAQDVMDWYLSDGKGGSTDDSSQMPLFS